MLQCLPLCTFGCSCQLFDLILAVWHHIWIVLGAISEAALAVAFMFLSKPFHGLEAIPWLAMMGAVVHAAVKMLAMLAPVNYRSFMRGLGHDIDQ